MIKLFYILTLLSITTGCKNPNNQANKGSTVVKITNGNLDLQNQVDRNKKLKKLIPKAEAETVIFKTRKEYEKWKESNKIKK